MKQSDEYRTGKKAMEDFERTMTALFRAPKTIIPTKRKAAEQKSSSRVAGAVSKRHQAAP